MMKIFNKFSIAMLLSCCAHSTFAADIGTVLCESSHNTAELTVSIGGITWKDWWNYESVQAHGITAEGRIISFDLQRLNPSKSTYLFSYQGPHEIVRVRTYVTTNMKDVDVSCN